MQKALRSLEIGARGFGGGGKFGESEPPVGIDIKGKLVRPNCERIFYIRHAFRAGYSVEKVHQLTAIDPWFLQQLFEIHEMELELENQSLENIDPILLKRANKFGFSDPQLAH
jgi:carbamoyl-phosphate synthase large subunit